MASRVYNSNVEEQRLFLCSWGLTGQTAQLISCLLDSVSIKEKQNKFHRGLERKTVDWYLFIYQANKNLLRIHSISGIEEKKKNKYSTHSEHGMRSQGQVQETAISNPYGIFDKLLLLNSFPYGRKTDDSLLRMRRHHGLQTHYRNCQQYRSKV